ncbi:PorT family protein [Flavobacteriaceae bacterium]|nr:PorT family protein [Flavobacteriaceae bacterium]MDA9330324.1 PorT family protein [bacterium]MDB4092738.1 PorT family protein [Flavobacteriaceae bacterium]MDB9849255.1 PorT family protein [Flavobacteriaceae bacterium]MDC0007963.1 PorT family protein [Flavobacteriaceae bacterium]
MKIFSLFLSLFFLSLSIYSQKNNAKISNLQNFDQKKLHFGYYVGVNNYNYKLDYILNPEKKTLISDQTGINVGLIGDLKLKKNLNLRFEPGLYTNKSDIVFYDRQNFTKNSDTLRSIKSTYIHLPLLIKYSAKRYNNLKPYVLAGLSTSFNLSSNQNSPEDNNNDVFRLKTNTFYYELGFGIDFYLQYFKFSPSIRGVFSLKNELVPDLDPNSPWTGNIDKMSVRAIFINFSFH